MISSVPPSDVALEAKTWTHQIQKSASESFGKKNMPAVFDVEQLVFMEEGYF
jgi:hypothetical protein